MQKTENFALNQWEATDALRRRDFNNDNAAIDAALATKAEKSAVTAVETALGNYKTNNDAAVNSKANATDVTALSQSVSALSTALGGKGNCKIAVGSYVGTGTHGVSNPISLSFDFQPILVVIACDFYTTYEKSPAVLIRGQTQAASDIGTNEDKSNLMQLTWTNNSVSWYCTTLPGFQCNNEGYEYYYAALGV